MQQAFRTERDSLVGEIAALKEEISKLKQELDEYKHLSMNSATSQKYIQWAQSKLEGQYSQKLSELQKLLYQEFSDAEQFQAQVENERKKMREKMTEMENIIVEQKEKLSAADGDMVKEKLLQEQLLQRLEEERKELQNIKSRLQEQEEQLKERFTFNKSNLYQATCKHRAKGVVRFQRIRRTSIQTAQLSS